MIQFDIPENIRKNISIEINIYDILGRKIISIYKGILPSGRYRVQWNGKDSLGNIQPSGVYIFTMISSNYSASKKMVLVR
jgi:flagellar hook assembly protein FlgD